MVELEQTATVRSVYRFRVWLRCFFACTGAFFALGAISTLLDLLVVPARSRSAFLLAFVLLAYPAVYLIRLAFRARLILEGSRIELRGAFWNRAADRSEIEGFRIVGARFGSYRKFMLKAGGRPISIHSGVKTDDTFRAWMDTIPDLNRRDRQALLTKIETRPELGPTPEDRLVTLADARERNVFALVLLVGAAIGFNVGSRIWVELCGAVLAIAPFATVWLCWRQPLLYAVFKRKQDPRAETSHGLLVSGFGLLFHMQQFNFLSVKPLLIAMVMMVVAIFAAYFEPALSGGGKRALFAILMTGALYSYGAVTMTDACFDASTGARYSTEVLGGHVTRGRSTSYYLRLAPWGPVGAVADVRVSSRLYHSAAQGSTVCMDLHPGWLRVPWYRVSACPAAGLR